MTVVDWMFTHPWMTFFILLALVEGIGSRVKVVKIESEDRKDK